jgi:hypothetical protein
MLAKRDTNRLAIGVLAVMLVVACVFVLKKWSPRFNSDLHGDHGVISAFTDERSHVVSVDSQTPPPIRERDRSHSTELTQRNQVDVPPKARPLSGTDDSVIGVPFLVPASLERVCVLGERKQGVDLCERQHNLLAEMAKQPRDLAWAAKTETLIQDEVLSLSPGDFFIRNIECRSSICAVELESPTSWYSGASYEFDAANGLVDGVTMGGAVETDSEGRQVKVSVVLFTKFDYTTSRSIR